MIEPLTDDDLSRLMTDRYAASVRQDWDEHARIQALIDTEYMRRWNASIDRMQELEAIRQK